MGASRRLLLLALGLTILVPAVSAEDVLFRPELPGDIYPHCPFTGAPIPFVVALVTTPGTCFCPWPSPADEQHCPIED